MSQLKLPITIGIYRTRDGSLALIARNARNPEDPRFSVFGSIIDGQEDEDSWTPTGGFALDGKPCGYDLVERVEIVQVLKAALGQLESYSLEHPSGERLDPVIRQVSGAIETLKPLETRRPPL